MKYDNNERAIRNFGELVFQYYLCSDLAGEIQKYLVNNLENGKYSSINSPEELAEQVTSDVRSVSQDQYLSLYFDPQYITDTKESQKNGLKPNYINDEANFGFEDVKILKGNVGYIKLTGFYDAEYAGEVATSAMNLVGRSKALIFDLRENGGGYMNMVQLLCSYLFGPESVLINEFKTRVTGSCDQVWTSPYVSGNKLPSIKVLVLTSRDTFSSAETFTYSLQALKRATVIGESTKGAASNGKVCIINDQYWAYIPNSNNVSPVTQQNWDKVGVQPDVKTSSDDAFDVAYELVMSSLSKSA